MSSEGEGHLLAEIGRRFLRLTSLATLLGACSADGAGGPSFFDHLERGPAVLAYYGDTSAVDVPAATRVGQPTTVRFTSFSGGCVSQDSTEAKVTGLSAEVRPFQRDPTRVRRNIVCPADLRLDNNVVELRFAQPGRAKVRILGLAQPGDHRFVLERDIEVTP
ncbi:MAG TPA: hypothetical protein VNO19_11855 [Gemmatimonadales bacterium]|nr:hypothetical protein [Gemmatimonadales bacterium]